MQASGHLPKGGSPDRLRGLVSIGHECGSDGVLPVWLAP